MSFAKNDDKVLMRKPKTKLNSKQKSTWYLELFCWIGVFSAAVFYVASDLGYLNFNFSHLAPKKFSTNFQKQEHSFNKVSDSIATLEGSLVRASGQVHEAQKSFSKLEDVLKVQRQEIENLKKQLSELKLSDRTLASDQTSLPSLVLPEGFFVATYDGVPGVAKVLDEQHVFEPFGFFLTPRGIKEVPGLAKTLIQTTSASGLVVISANDSPKSLMLTQEKIRVVGRFLKEVFSSEYEVKVQLQSSSIKTVSNSDQISGEKVALWAPLSSFVGVEAR
jgi:hypothetical protein